MVCIEETLKKDKEPAVYKHLKGSSNYFDLYVNLFIFMGFKYQFHKITAIIVVVVS